MSQAHVSRTLKLVADHPEVLDTTPLEVGWRYATGQIGEDAMLEELKAWPYTFGRFHDNAWERGTWDDVMLLVADRILTDEQYEELRAAVVPGVQHAR